MPCPFGQRFIPAGRPIVTDATRDIAALIEDGWSARESAWMVQVCSHGGVFLRSQLAASWGCSEGAARRATQRFVARKIAIEAPLHPERGGRSPNVCHVRSRRIYRRLAIEHVHDRRLLARRFVFRRLLCLDCVVDQGGRWHGPEMAKVELFDRLKIPRSALPQRLFPGSEQHRYFQAKLPIAFDGDTVSFMFTPSRPRERRSIRHWARQHMRLWAALSARGYRVRVVGVAGNGGDADSLRRRLALWIEANAQEPAGLDDGERELLAAVER